MIQQNLKNFYVPLRRGAQADAQQAFQWLLAGRLSFLLTVLTMVILHQVVGRGSLAVREVGVAYGVLVFQFGFNLLCSIFLEKVPKGKLGICFQILVDTLSVSAWGLWSYGHNFYALFYLVQILIVALIYYQRTALFASLVASVCYGVVSIWSTPDLTGVLAIWSAYTVLFLTLGFVGGYLSDELHSTSLKLHENQEVMDRLTKLHDHIISTMPTGLLAVDPQRRISYLNAAAESILKRKAEELIGKLLGDVAPGLIPFFSSLEDSDKEEDSEIGKDGAKHYFAKSATGSEHTRLQQIVEMNVAGERRILRGDVSDLAVDWWSVGPLGSGGRVLLFQEVTKLLQLEEKVKQNEKLAAVGQLAAGIAHEIRNPLASMSGSIELLKNSLPREVVKEENEKLMDIALREIDRLNLLITDFLTYVKPGQLKMAKVSLKDLLAEILQSVQTGKNFPSNIRVNTPLNAEVFALANADKIKQVTWNLVMNAVQAMPQGGILEVGCKILENNKAHFWVKDTGIGMSEDVKKHLFEPFFTTKDKGTGLGLAIAYKIVEAHAGEIRVQSQKAQGTQFEVDLPLY